jgi:hypothetical protein
MITSVIYKTVVEYYRDLCPVVRKINDISKFSDKLIKNKSQICRYFYNPEDKIDHLSGSADIHRKYLIACRKQERKKMASSESLVNVEDMRTMAKIAQRMPLYSPDTDMHEIENINEQLYSQKELEIWTKMSKENGYDLRGEITKFISKLLKMIQTNSSLK